MSYEGYTQKICKNGHEWEEDCWADEFSHRCPICQERCVWWNMIDLTNGSFDEETNERIDGYVDLKVKDRKKCECCGSVLETIYEIPKKGHKENEQKTKRAHTKRAKAGSKKT